jgi:hypothetical protein
MSTGQREGIKEGDWETPWDHVHLQRDPETGEYAEVEFCGRGEKCRRGEDPTQRRKEAAVEGGGGGGRGEPPKKDPKSGAKKAENTGQKTRKVGGENGN